MLILFSSISNGRRYQH